MHTRRDELARAKVELVGRPLARAHDERRHAKVTLPTSGGAHTTAGARDVVGRGTDMPAQRSISAVVNKGVGARAVAGKTIDFRKIDTNNPSQKRLEEKLRRRMNGT